MRPAVVYVRVSSKEQEKEGFSIPAQLKLLREYALSNGIRVVEEYVDVETAKQAGRSSFGEMVNYLHHHPEARIILVEKTDRLYRNPQGLGDPRRTRSGDSLRQGGASSSPPIPVPLKSSMHGIKVLMAKNYIDNLSEETRKGMMEKAEQGIWPFLCAFRILQCDGREW